MKTCAKCRAALPLEAFGPKRSNPDGLQRWCTTCRNEAMTRYTAQRRVDAVRGARLRETCREASKAYRARHPGRVVLQRRAAYAKPGAREAAARRSATWYEANKEYARVVARLNAATRRARKFGVAVVPFTLEAFLERMAYYGFRCWVCGAEATSMDHVKPFQAGGAHCLANIRPACKPCNDLKRTRWPYAEVLAWRAKRRTP